MIATSEVVVLVTSQHSGSVMNVRRINELQCVATSSNGMMSAIRADSHAWQTVLQGWEV